MVNQQGFNLLLEGEANRILKEKPLAYFCAEFALSDVLPTYAGGLGILAGDYIRELEDQNVPAIAIGLCYRDNYPGKKNNEKEEVFSKEITPESVGLQPVLNASGKPILIKIPIQDKEISARAWVWQYNTIPVYLLDTDCPENDPQNRQITHKLYSNNKEIRLKQEIILGIGGYRLLQALSISPSIFHMNEGHSAMLALEIIHHEMQKRKIGFSEALKMSLHHLIFTNHTLVAAGNETFSRELFTLMLNRYASELEVPVIDIFNIGAIQESSTFSMSLFALRLSGKSNAVSVLHGKYAEKIWPDYKIEAITNGVHIPTWDKIGHTSLRGTKQSHEELATPTGLPRSFTLVQQAGSSRPPVARNDVNIVDAHQENKRELLHYIQEQTGQTWKEDALLIGWARRMVNYKRPLALFGEIDKLRQLVENQEKPVKIIISGSAHPADDEGIQLVNQMQNLIKQLFPDTIVYLPNYKKDLAQRLVAGTDVWLNTPVVGSEACGTSGMKAALNGVLPVTTKDGWVYEIDIPQFGWELQNDTIHEDLFRVLIEQVVPEFFQNQTNWQQRMQKSRALILEKYSATRMLKDYMEKMYIPIIEDSKAHYFSEEVVGGSE